MDSKKQEEFYIGFKKQLEESQEFPSNYLFKFIINNEPEKEKQLREIFKNANAEYSQQLSKTGKYISFSIKLYVIDADTIIQYYKEAGKIENIILL